MVAVSVGEITAVLYGVGVLCTGEVMSLGKGGEAVSLQEE